VKGWGWGMWGGEVIDGFVSVSFFYCGFVVKECGNYHCCPIHECPL
jgi:hypothetical protein